MKKIVTDHKSQDDFSIIKKQYKLWKFCGEYLSDFNFVISYPVI